MITFLLYILTFEAEGLVRRHQAKFPLYLLILLSPGRWEVQTAATSGSSRAFETIRIKICGDQLRGQGGVAFVPRALVLGLIDFFSSWPHAQHLSPGHTWEKEPPATPHPGSGLRSRSSVSIYLVPLSGEKCSSGSHVVTRISKSSSLWVSDRCGYVRWLYQ